MAERNKIAMYLAIVAGVLLFVAGITGIAFINKIKEFVLTQFNNEALQWVFVILIFLASLGGLLVIAGGVFIGKNKVGLGKILITIGVGTGLIGLIFALIWLVKQQSIETTPTSIFSLVGVILSVVARMMAKKDEAPQGQQPGQYPQPPAQAQPQPQVYQPSPTPVPQPQPAPAPQPQPAPVQPQPQTQPQPPNQPKNACPDCGTPMEYITQYQRWYCQICRKYP